MAILASPQDKQLTYKDILNRPSDERWELINGMPCAMTPAPNRRHQEIVGVLFARFFTQLEGKPCKVYVAPFDVRLPEKGERDEEINTVVQPDIVVVCDPSKLDERGCKGAPDLVVEVLSPETAQKDLITKLSLYERAGVKQYWVVHPTDEIVMVFALGPNNEYAKPKIFGKSEEIKVEMLNDVTIASIF